MFRLISIQDKFEGLEVLVFEGKRFQELFCLIHVFD